MGSASSLGWRVLGAKNNGNSGSCAPKQKEKQANLPIYLIIIILNVGIMRPLA